MNNMQEFKSIVTSFGLAKSILNIETPEGYAPSHAHKDYHPLLTKLNQHSDILGMAVTQIERYMKHVRGVITEGQENARAAVFLSKYSHQKTLESMLHFIDFCVTRARPPCHHANADRVAGARGAARYDSPWTSQAGT